MTTFDSKQKSTIRRKTSFPKGIVENEDLLKPILNKIIITQEKCVKYDFIAPLSFWFLTILSLIFSSRKLKSWIFIFSLFGGPSKGFMKTFKLFSLFFRDQDWKGQNKQRRCQGNFVFFSVFLSTWLIYCNLCLRRVS